MRILKERFQFHDLVSNVLTFDYLGALGASLLFPIVLVPKLGMVRSAMLFGLVNAGVALWSTYIFRSQLGRLAALRTACATVILALGIGMVFADRITEAADNGIYADDVILSKTTKYQRIVLTKWKDDLRLFLSSHLQFSSRDEYRYHEALVHPGLASLGGARNVLVLGGGDGLAVREILKYPQIQAVTLVDLDDQMTDLFTRHPVLSGLNLKSLSSPKVKVINADAFPWLEQDRGYYDFVVIDFPDPTNFSLGKLYTTAFYRLVEKHLTRDGLCVVQSTSPLFARSSFWTVAETLKQSGFHIWPYHLYVPSFGEWGFVLAGRTTYHYPVDLLPKGLRFLDANSLPVMFQFPEDMKPVAVEANKLNDQVLVRTYDREWRDIAR